MNKDYAEMADSNWKNHEKRLEAQNKGRSGAGTNIIGFGQYN